ncbi:MAG: DUF1080 domain-containing protein [Bacteroidota bacterium]
MKKISVKMKSIYAGMISMKTFLLINLTACILFVLATSLPANAQDKSEWRQLFNGKDLTGWKQVGPGSHYVESGLIKSKGGMGLLVWEGEKFQNCIIRVAFAMRDSNSNAGVFIRIPTMPTEEWMPVNKGYEVQIDNAPEKSNEDEYHYTGTLYSLTKPLAKTGKPGPQWNTMEITLDGTRTIVFLNDVKVTDFKEGDPVPAKKFDFEPERGPRPISGYMGIQNHGDKDIVFFKEVAVKPLKTVSK